MWSVRPLVLSAFSLLAVLVVSALPVRAEAVNSKDGRFAATFPGSARMSTTPVQSGDVTVRMTVYAFENGQLNYYVSYSDYPPRTFDRLSRDQAYVNVINATLANVKGRKEREADVKLGDVTGREVLIDVPAQHATMRERLFLVGNRLYQVVYGGPPGSANAKPALDFLNSFKLLP
jgi:hypothetical protein